MKMSCRNIVVLLLLTSFTSGCASFWYELKPHRLKRWNRGPAPSLDPDFTQSDRSSETRLVRLERDRSRTPGMTANRAEVTLARGQNPAE
jgi:hypothetical protein